MWLLRTIASRIKIVHDRAMWYNVKKPRKIDEILRREEGRENEANEGGQLELGRS